MNSAVVSVVTCGPAAPIKLPPGQRKQQQIAQSHKLKDDNQVGERFYSKVTVTSFLAFLYLSPFICFFSFLYQVSQFYLEKSWISTQYASVIANCLTSFLICSPGRDPNQTQIASHQTSPALTSGSRSKLQAVNWRLLPLWWFVSGCGVETFTASVTLTVRTMFVL